MRIAYSSGTVSMRRLDTFFHRFLVCYIIGTILGLLAVRTSMISIEDTMMSLSAGVSLAGRGASVALFRSGCFLFLITILISQLSGRAFFLMLLVVCKAFATAYVFGALYALRETSGSDWVHFLIYTVLFLPVFYCLVFHCQGSRLRGRGRYWFYYRILPILWMFCLLAAAVWLSAALSALF